MRSDKILKKLNLQYKYLTLELEEVKTDLTVYQQEFTRYLYTLQSEHDISILTEKSKKSSEEVKEGEEDEALLGVDIKRDRKQDKLFKVLYNQICNITHPDKTNGDAGMTRLFRFATKAKNDNNLMDIIDLCEDLSIDIPELEEEHILIIERNVKSIQEKINNVKNQDAWIWSTADASGKKKIEKNIVKMFKQ